MTGEKKKFQYFTWGGPSMVLRLPIGIMTMDECSFKKKKINGQYITFINVLPQNGKSTLGVAVCRPVSRKGRRNVI